MQKTGYRIPDMVDHKDHSEKKHKNSAEDKKRWIIENVLSLGFAIFVVLIIRSSIIEAFKIPSDSMVPTLLTGDHIFVNKFSYGFKVPFSDWIFDEPTYIVKRDPPKRGDIIVFLYPEDTSKYFIKRVVGVPGDTITVQDKIVFINGKEATRTPLTEKDELKYKDTIDDQKYQLSNLDIYREKLDTADHLVMYDQMSIESEDYGPTAVPPDSFFVMGDNRDYSRDSRRWGFVPMKYIKGKAMIVWLSLWLDGPIFRPSRIGTILN